MNPNTEKLFRRATIGLTVTAAYFLLTDDYGSRFNALDPIKKTILSAQTSVKEYILGTKKEPLESQVGNSGKEHP